jgi:hypothetical protein
MNIDDNVGQAPFDPNASPDLNRENARAQTAQISALITVASEQLGQTYRWLLASLLSINGGGIIALFSADENIPKLAIAQSAGLMLTGMILAIMVGLLSALRSGPAFDLLGQYLNYASSIVHDGTRDLDIELELQADGKKISYFSYGIIGLGVVSLILFIVGVANVICSFAANVSCVCTQ